MKVKVLSFIVCAWLATPAEGDAFEYAEFLLSGNIVGPGYCSLSKALGNDLMMALQYSLGGFQISDVADPAQPKAAIMMSAAVIPGHYGNVTIVEEWKLAAIQIWDPLWKMQCARSFDSFTNACSVVVQLKTPDGKVHGWPMGFYGFRSEDDQISNQTNTVLGIELVLNETTTCSAVYSLTDGVRGQHLWHPQGPFALRSPGAPTGAARAGRLPAVTHVRAKGAPGDPPVVPRVTPTEAPEEEDPWWLWPVIILVIGLKVSLWVWICRRRCRRIRAYATGPQQDGIPLT
eukprot:s19_g21.t1